MPTRFSRPTKLPVELDYGVFARELAEAQYSLGLLEGLQRKLLNPSLLIAPLTAKEAAVSSRIEGTQSTASDVFLFEAGGEAKYRDTAEVANYRKAMTYAISEFRDGKTFTAHFIKTVHSILLEGVRHKGTVGDFRGGPVWIAHKSGDPIEKATYIPPEHVFVPEYMDNLITYINSTDENTLVLSGISHYQFEAVHPFDDGNGRIGRLLIPYLLHYKGKLSLPIIYLSGYFDQNRDRYISALHEVDTTGRYEVWISFFLSAVQEQATETRNLIEGIYNLYDKLKGKLYGIKSPYVIPGLDFIFRHPIFSTPQLVKELKVTRITAVRLVRLLEKERILRDIQSAGGRTKFYAFMPLLKLLQ